MWEGLLSRDASYSEGSGAVFLFFMVAFIYEKRSAFYK